MLRFLLVFCTISAPFLTPYCTRFAFKLATLRFLPRVFLIFPRSLASIPHQFPRHMRNVALFVFFSFTFCTKTGAQTGNCCAFRVFYARFSHQFPHQTSNCCASGAKVDASSVFFLARNWQRCASGAFYDHVLHLPYAQMRNIFKFCSRDWCKTRALSAPNAQHPPVRPIFPLGFCIVLYFSAKFDVFSYNCHNNQSLRHFQKQKCKYSKKFGACFFNTSASIL